MEPADQLLDHRPAQPIVLIAQQATAGAELGTGQGVLVLVQVAAVLAVQVTDLADGRHAEADQVAMAVRGVTLEIALQGRFFLGDGQFIVGQGEMVHADVAITGGGQLLDGALKHFQLFGRRRQVVAVDSPLRHEALGQVGVVEHRKAVGLQADDFFDSAVEVFGGLLGQAVDQVDVDRAELQGARGIDHRSGFLQALQAIDRPLYRRVEILQADTDAIEAQFPQQAHGRPVRFPGVDFDAVVARIVIQQVEVLAQLRHQLAQFVMAEKGRGAATEVQLFDFLVRVQVAGDQLDFLFQALQVGLGAAAILGDDFVAGAVVADVRAKRHVHIQRERAPGLAAVAQGVEQVERADLAVELHGGRVRGVAWSRQVITADQIGVPTNGVEHHAGIPPDRLAMSATLCEGGVGHLDLHQGQNLCCL
ncbi:hypothetical protein D3C78_874690 [compost metagenome]